MQLGRRTGWSCPRSRVLVVLVALLLGWAWPNAHAAEFPDVQVNGLFGGQAVLTINGKQRLLKPGQTAPEGVLLVSATLEQAVVAYRGTRRKLGLSRRVAGTYETRTQAVVTLNADSLGQYRTQIIIGGQPVGCLIDTGASLIAISSAQADKLGIDYLAGREGQVITANGRATSYYVNLPEVVLGGITQRNVSAAIVRGFYPEEVLLGMSFLSSLKMEESGGVMSLTRQY